MRFLKSVIFLSVCLNVSAFFNNEKIPSIKIRLNAIDSRKNVDNIEEIVKLKVEAAAPFRLLRQTVYFGLGGAGGLGTITSLSQLIATIQMPNPSLDVNSLATNVAINSVALISAIFLLKFEADKQKEQYDKFMDKQKKISNQLTPDESTELQSFLSKLPIEIVFSETNENVTKIVSVGELQNKAKQNLVIVAGESDFVNECIVSARLEGYDFFNSRNTLVVPFIYNEDEEIPEELDQKKSKGFGAKEPMSFTFIGKPKQPNVWYEYLRSEVSTAKEQGNKDIVKKGFVLLVNSKGKIIKRGLGLPPWKEILKDL
eukprot:gene5048-7045_t